ncbi:hypothetical protein GGI42DRAFT_120958 [Trichoderma sp. SZMC 28013]
MGTLRTAEDPDRLCRKKAEADGIRLRPSVQQLCSIVVAETAAEVPSVESLSFLFVLLSFYVFVGEPGASSFGRCRDASLPCVDGRGFGGHGTGFSTKKKKKNRRRNALQIRVRSTGARREKRRKLQAPKARGGSWLATAVPCCLWAGEEEERGGKSVGDVFFFFLFHFFSLPPPTATARLQATSCQCKSQVPQRHAKGLANPWAWDGMAIGARASLANHRLSLSKP